MPSHVRFRPGAEARSVVRHRLKRLSEGTAEANYHGDCAEPRLVNVAAPITSLVKEMARWDHAPGYGWLLDQPEWDTRSTSEWVSVRCRKCGPCLAVRTRLWTARAITELAQADRTWFGTLTLNPFQRLSARARAEAALKGGGERWDHLSPPEQFQATAAQVGPELQRWLKRLRKASGAHLRYLLVCEAHKSGDPHWHVLMHEVAGSATKRDLDKSWRYGFSQWRLCKDRTGREAVYVCKYLAKSALTRVRASRHYGRFHLTPTIPGRGMELGATRACTDATTRACLNATT